MRLVSLSALLVLSAATAAPAAEPQKAQSEKKICKKTTEIGSLVKATKVCRTAREWRTERESARDATKELQSSRLSGPNG